MFIILIMYLQKYTNEIHPSIFVLSFEPEDVYKRKKEIHSMIKKEKAPGAQFLRVYEL